MNDLIVKTDSKSYPIHIEDSFKNLKKSFTDDIKKICIVTDSNVKELYAGEILKILSSLCKEVSIFSFEAGENSKNLATLRDIYEFFVTAKLDRRSLVVALGGGVTGDLAGFAAASYMRGIRFIQIPTTLLSQVDSSTGGKTGVDFLGHKNLVGAFHQPEFVYINVNTLKTLSRGEFASGMAEAIKHGLVKDKNYYNFIKENKQAILDMDTKNLKNLIFGSCTIKSEIVSEDEKETGIRELLNFGHTFGHALESLASFVLTHGDCVSIGMVCALCLSNKFKHISNSEFLEIKELLSFFLLSIDIWEIASDAIYSEMLLDKKVKNNEIDLILLKSIGNGYIYEKAPKDEIIWAINEVKKGEIGEYKV